MPTATPSRRPDEPGVILADALYTLDELKRRAGLGQAALRTARRAGLKIRQIGRRRFVLGRDLLAYVERAAV